MWLPFRGNVEQDQRKPVKLISKMREKRLAREFSEVLRVEVRKGYADPSDLFG